jgi:hypothetical protein
MRASLPAAALLASVLAGCSGGRVATKDTEEPDELTAFLKTAEAEIMVLPGTAAAGGVSFSAPPSILTLQDADAIARECQSIQAVAPVVRARSRVSHGDKEWVPLYLYGTTPAWLDVRRWRDLTEGEAFTDADVRSGARVCVIGQTVKRELFGGRSPLGQEIRKESHAFKVVGVLTSRGANLMGLDTDDVVLVPWTALPAPKPAAPRSRSVDQIIARARSVEEVPAALRHITELLRKRHGIKAGQPDDFTVRDMTDVAKALRER